MNTAQAMPQNMKNQSRNRRGSGLAGWLVIFSCALVGINMAKQQFRALPAAPAQRMAAAATREWRRMATHRSSRRISMQLSIQSLSRRRKLCTTTQSCVYFWNHVYGCSPSWTLIQLETAKWLSKKYCISCDSSRLGGTNAVKRYSSFLS